MLNEVKQLLSAADPEQAGYWWLMWALYQCGDRQTALALYQQNRTITAKAGTETPRALVAAACGDRSLALALLAQERQAAAAGKVLAARLLLNKTVQPESRFSYRLDGVEHSGSLNSISDHLLSLNGDNQRLVLAEAEEQLCYVEIFIEKPQLAAVSGPQ